MKTIKLILRGVCLALALFMFAGCSMVSVDEEMDNSQVVATVNGEQILKGDIMDEFNIYSSYYGHDITQPNTGENKTNGDAYKDIVWQEHVDHALITQKAAELGITLSQERIDDIAAAITSNEEYFMELSQTLALESVGEGDKLEEETQRLYQNYLESNGISNGIFEALQTRYAWQDEMTDYLAQSIEPTDEEMRAWYDENLAAQIEEVDGFPGGVLTHHTSDKILYIPEDEGFKYIRNLAIELPQNIQDEIYTLRSSGEDDAADALRDEELAKIKDEVDAAYERILGGEDFATVCAELTDDTFMDNDENQEFGRVFFNAIGGEADEFVEATKNLVNVGDYTEPVASDKGYYIVQYSKELPEGEVSYEDAMDIAKEQVIASQASAKYLEELEKWRTEATIEDFKSRLY